MKFAVRSRPASAPPGLTGPARVDRRTTNLLGRLRPGDIAVVDHLDMDRATAQALADARVAAVVNASAMISGRFPNLGPQTLIDAGVVVVDTVGSQVLARVKDGTSLRLHDGELFVGDTSIATGRVLGERDVAEQMEAARRGLTAQLESFTHNSTEFLRREQELLLHGHGVPETASQVGGRPVVVVVRSHDWESELRGIKAFLREQKPLLVGVDRGADAIVDSGHSVDVVVTSGGTDDLPRAEVLRKATDVVVLVERGAPRSATEHLSRMGIKALRFETGATAEDAALLIADTGGASTIVGVGMHATLDEFLDRRRPGLASTFLTRLKVGPRLVDAAAIPTLYDGRVRPRHLLLLAVAGLASLAAAVGITPVGQEWVADATPALNSALDSVQGLLR